MEKQGPVSEDEKAILHCNGHEHSTLWGCESLTLQAADQKKLSKDRQTTCLANKRLRKKMDYIATMEEVIDERRLDWLDNVARQTDKKS
jgi:hypothetical protein